MEPIENVPSWWLRVHCDGPDGGAIQRIKTGRTEHEIVEVGYPTHCPSGHLMGPLRGYIASFGCPADEYHRTMRCVRCDAVWVDRECTIRPGWRTAGELRGLQRKYRPLRQPRVAWDGGDG